MADDKKKKKTEIREDALIVDFTKVGGDLTHENDKQYIITESAARLANQLVADYQRLTFNEKNMVKVVLGVIGELTKVGRDRLVNEAMVQQFETNKLLNMVQLLSKLVLTLNKSVDISNSILELMIEVANGTSIVLN